MAITDKTGINVASGFKLVAPVPIDARFVATDETDLQSLITNNAVYKGLTVWVESLGKSMVYNGTEFIPIASGSVPENVVEVVEMPQSLVIKLLTAYNAGGDTFELTDDELDIFENYENKKYVAVSPDVGTTSVVFTPSLRGLMDEDSLILYSGEFFMVQISFDTKTGRAGRTINSQDYDYLQRRITEAEEDLEKKVDQTYVDEQLGSIDEVLDEINGSGTINGGESSNTPNTGSNVNLMDKITIVVTTNIYNDTVIAFQDNDNGGSSIFKENHKYEITFDFLGAIRMAVTITRTLNRLPVSSPIYGRVNLGSGETGVIGYFDMLEFGILRLNIYQVGQDTNLANAIISSMTFTGVYDLGEYD